MFGIKVIPILDRCAGGVIECGESNVPSIIH